MRISIDGTTVDLAGAFAKGEWEGSKDRRWLVLPLAFDFRGRGRREHGHRHRDEARNVTLKVELTEKGKREEAGRGGKVLSSVELIQYGPPDRYAFLFATDPGHAWCSMRGGLQY